MQLNRLSIQRQHDNTFALVVVVESSDGFKREITLEGGATKANELQKSYMHFLRDEESLAIEVQYKLFQEKEVI